MKCPNCGAENPEGKKFCGDCGSPLNGLSAKWQVRIAKQIATVILLISVLLIIIGLGFNSASEDVSRAYTYGDGPVGSELLDLAWLFAWLGIIGFLVAGFAYLFSLPTPKKERKEV